MKIKDRIKEFKRVKSSELAANPLNWRTHPDHQRKAFRGILDEIGIAGAVVAYQTSQGLRLIDGHLRKEEYGKDTPIPVLILDVTEEEANKLLATFDPISDMAGMNNEALNELLESVAFNSDDVNNLLQSLASQNSEMELPEPEKQDMSYSERYEILITCDSENEQARLLERLDKEGIKCRSLIS